MKRIARKHGVALSFSNKNTIKQGLVKLKQKTEILKKKDCIYQIPLNCGKSYIGETSQLWKERKRQHKEAFQNRHIRKSAVYEHMTICNQECGEKRPSVQWKNSKIIGYACNWDVRRARESLEIKLQNKKKH